MEPTKLTTFGNILIGTWFCGECGNTYTPRQLSERIVTICEGYVVCPNCDMHLTYDEAA
jgi:hypothetical protein